MSGKAAVLIANSRFNITPIRTRYSEPSTDLGELQSKVVVIHSSNDFYVDTKYVTQLAIADQWSLQGTLSYYDDGQSHMALIDNPTALAKVYRKAFEEQVKT
eukprot:101125_1